MVGGVRRENHFYFFSFKILTIGGFRIDMRTETGAQEGPRECADVGRSSKASQ